MNREEKKNHEEDTFGIVRSISLKRIPGTVENIYSHFYFVFGVPVGTWSDARTGSHAVCMPVTPCYNKSFYSFDYRRHLCKCVSYCVAFFCNELKQITIHTD